MYITGWFGEGALGFKVGYEEVYVGSLLEGLEGSAFVGVGSCGVFLGGRSREKQGCRSPGDVTIS